MPSEQALIDQLHFAGIRVEIVQKDGWFVILADGHGQKHIARGIDLRTLLQEAAEVFELTS